MFPFSHGGLLFTSLVVFLSLFSGLFPKHLSGVHFGPGKTCFEFALDLSIEDFQFLPRENPGDTGHRDCDQEGLHRRRGFAIAFGGWIRCKGSSIRRKDMKKGNSWAKAQGWPPSSWDGLSHDNESGALYRWPHFFISIPLLHQLQSPFPPSKVLLCPCDFF